MTLREDFNNGTLRWLKQLIGLAAGAAMIAGIGWGGYALNDANDPPRATTPYVSLPQLGERIASIETELRYVKEAQGEQRQELKEMNATLQQILLRLQVIEGPP